MRAPTVRVYGLFPIRNVNCRSYSGPRAAGGLRSPHPRLATFTPVTFSVNSDVSYGAYEDHEEKLKLLSSCAQPTTT